MSDREHADGWRLVYLHPRRVLLWANVAAATACFAIAALWVLYGSWYTFLQWELALLVVGAVLTLVAEVGFFLERR